MIKMILWQPVAVLIIVTLIVMLLIAWYADNHPRCSFFCNTHDDCKTNNLYDDFYIDDDECLLSYETLQTIQKMIDNKNKNRGEDEGIYYAE